jgi:hypothetical protein
MDPFNNLMNNGNNLETIFFNLPYNNIASQVFPDPRVSNPYIDPLTISIALNMYNIILSTESINYQEQTDVKNVIDKDELGKLKVSSYIDLDKDKYKTCSICLDDYTDECKLRILKCEHGFHVDCIDKWLTDCNYKCPICRDDSNKHHSED